MTRFKIESDYSDYGWLLAIIAVGILLRVTTVFVLHIEPESDYAAYQSMAINLVAGKGIVDFMGNLAMYNVGYPLFVLAPVFWLFGNNLLAAQLMNTLLGVAVILLCYTVAQKAGAGRTGCLFAAALWALYLPSLVYAAYLAKENFMTPLMLGVVWCALCLTKKISQGVAVGCGVLFGLLALTGNAALSLAFPVIGALAFAPASLGRKLLAIVLALTAASAVVTPWLVRNYKALGVPVLNTNGGFNLYLGNNPAATGRFVDIADTPRGATWEGLRKEGEVQASETLRREAVAWIQTHPSEFIVLAFKKVALFWTPPFHEGKGPGSTMETLIRRLWLTQYILLALGCFGLLLFPNLRTPYTGILWLAIASYTAVHMLFYVIFRYREPIMPLICVLAAISFEHLWVRFNRRNSYSKAVAH